MGLALRCPKRFYEKKGITLRAANDEQATQ